MSTPPLGAHARALLMPATAGLVLPWWLAHTELDGTPLRSSLGAVLALGGWAMVAWTVVLFARRGRGTLAPWDPTQVLVVAGPFAHVRNPMISGVAFAIAGTAVATGSHRVGLWALAFVAVNHVYFVAFEEPGLRRRFGAAYEAYAREVPRWLPRWRAYAGPSTSPSP